jgi:hypothetical protein
LRSHDRQGAANRDDKWIEDGQGEIAIETQINAAPCEQGEEHRTEGCKSEEIGDAELKSRPVHGNAPGTAWKGNPMQ